jgi:hypothetical protein
MFFEPNLRHKKPTNTAKKFVVFCQAAGQSGTYTFKHLVRAIIRIRIISGMIHIKIENTCIITIIPITTEIR